jgi:hypothetical protein
VFVAAVRGTTVEEEQIMKANLLIIAARLEHQGQVFWRMMDSGCEGKALVDEDSVKHHHIPMTPLRYPFRLCSGACGATHIPSDKRQIQLR